MTSERTSERTSDDLDVQTFIDQQRLSSTHLAILAICSTIMLIDGFDIFVVGKLAPAIAASFGKPAASMTIVFALQQAGLAAGGFIVGPLADRYGRKSTLTWCILGFGLLTLACLAATSLFQLAVLRGLSGIFLSGVILNVVTLLAEISPAGSKSKLVTIAFGGYTVGSAAGAVVAAWLLEDFGWEIGFWIGGLAPLAILPLVIYFLPESIQFRARRNPRDPQIVATLRRFAPATDFAKFGRFTVPQPQSLGTVRLLEIFQNNRLQTTILIWMAYFLALGNVALLASWMPSFFKEMAGVPIQRYALYSLNYFAGSLVGVVTVGMVMDRFGARRVLPAYCLINSVALFMLGQVPFGSPLFVTALLTWGFFQSGAQSGLNALAASVYPSDIRTTGVGAAFGAGRIGGIIVPLAGGLALATHLSLEIVLVLVAVPPLLVAIALVLLKTGVAVPAGNKESTG